MATKKKGKDVIVKKTKANMWEVRKDGNERATAVVFTRKDALRLARRAAKSERSKVIVEDA
jgi:hypothetical protein